MLAESLALTAALFIIGVVGVLVHRNAIIIFMCVELMLTAVNLTFVAFSRFYGAAGQVFVVFVMTVVCRRSGGWSRNHHRDLPPSSDGRPKGHQPAQGLMLLQTAELAASQAHPLSGTLAEWVWLLPIAAAGSVSSSTACSRSTVRDWVRTTRTHLITTHTPKEPRRRRDFARGASRRAWRRPPCREAASVGRHHEHRRARRSRSHFPARARDMAGDGRRAPRKRRSSRRTSAGCRPATCRSMLRSSSISCRW